MAVHKVTAKDDASAKSSKKVSPKKSTTKAVKATKVTKAKTTKPSRPTPKGLKPFVAIGGYFKGAWLELRQVRWPTRKATWELTLAVIVFTAFFTTIILLLDAGFKSLFEIILK